MYQTAESHVGKCRKCLGTGKIMCSGMGTMSIACDCSEEHKYKSVGKKPDAVETKSPEIRKESTLTSEIAEIPKKKTRGRPKRTLFEDQKGHFQ